MLFKLIIFETKFALFELVSHPLRIKPSAKQPAFEAITRYTTCFANVSQMNKARSFSPIVQNQLQSTIDNLCWPAEHNFIHVADFLFAFQVSVSCGIPDFRSRDGIYSKLSVEYPDLPDPQAMFDIDYFCQNPRPFFKFAKVKTSCISLATL